MGSDKDSNPSISERESRPSLVAALIDFLAFAPAADTEEHEAAS